jgi:hypothetical protein
MQVKKRIQLIQLKNMASTNLLNLENLTQEECHSYVWKEIRLAELNFEETWFSILQMQAEAGMYRR